MESEQALTYVIGALILLLVVFRVLYARSRKQSQQAMRGENRPEPEITLFGDNDDSRSDD